MAFRTRSLLHRNKLEDFTQWLTSNEYKLLETRGDYEVLRWREGDGRMAFVYDRHQGDHFTVGKDANRTVLRWIRERNNENC